MGQRSGPHRKTPPQPIEVDIGRATSQRSKPTRLSLNSDCDRLSGGARYRGTFAQRPRHRRSRTRCSLRCASLVPTERADVGCHQWPHSRSRTASTKHLARLQRAGEEVEAHHPAHLGRDRRCHAASDRDFGSTTGRLSAGSFPESDSRCRAGVCGVQLPAGVLGRAPARVSKPRHLARSPQVTSAWTPTCSADSLD